LRIATIFAITTPREPSIREARRGPATGLGSPERSNGFWPAVIPPAQRLDLSILGKRGADRAICSRRELHSRLRRHGGPAFRFILSVPVLKRTDSLKNILQATQSFV
jgi:hypothetical protein